VSPGRAVRVKLHHAAEIDRADDIDIVQNEGLVDQISNLQEEPCRFLSRHRVSRMCPARDFNRMPSCSLPSDSRRQVGEVMRVDDYFANPEVAQAREWISRMCAGISTALSGDFWCVAASGCRAGGENHRFIDRFLRTSFSTRDGHHYLHAVRAAGASPMFRR